MAVNLVSIWALMVSVFILDHGIVIRAEVLDADDASTNYDSGDDIRIPFTDWTRHFSSFMGRSDWSPSSSPDKLQLEEQVGGALPLQNKRAVYGLLGLATKRPHKTASELQHLPPQDAFIAVKGKKSFSNPVDPFPYPVIPPHLSMAPERESLSALY